MKDNSTASQRSRILQHLKSGKSLTTIQARHNLDAMHVGMRVCELRKQGFNIETHWTIDVTPEGYEHKCAKYILKPSTKEQLSLFGKEANAHE